MNKEQFGHCYCLYNLYIKVLKWFSYIENNKKSARFLLFFKIRTRNYSFFTWAKMMNLKSVYTVLLTGSVKAIYGLILVFRVGDTSSQKPIKAAKRGL